MQIWASGVAVSDVRQVAGMAGTDQATGRLSISPFALPSPAAKLRPESLISLRFSIHKLKYPGYLAITNDDASFRRADIGKKVIHSQTKSFLRWMIQSADKLSIPRLSVGQHIQRPPGIGSKVPCFERRPRSTTQRLRPPDTTCLANYVKAPRRIRLATMPVVDVVQYRQLY